MRSIKSWEVRSLAAAFVAALAPVSAATLPDTIVGRALGTVAIVVVFILWPATAAWSKRISQEQYFRFGRWFVFGVWPVIVIAGAAGVGLSWARWWTLALGIGSAALVVVGFARHWMMPRWTIDTVLAWLSVSAIVLRDPSPPLAAASGMWVVLTASTLRGFVLRPENATRFDLGRYLRRITLVAASLAASFVLAWGVSKLEGPEAIGRASWLPAGIAAALAIFALSTFERRGGERIDLAIIPSGVVTAPFLATAGIALLIDNGALIPPGLVVTGVLAVEIMLLQATIGPERQTAR